MEKEDDSQQRAPRLVREPGPQAVCGTGAAASRQSAYEIGKQLASRGQDDQCGPEPWAPRQEKPCGQDQGNKAGRNQASPQIVDHLPPVDPGHTVWQPGAAGTGHIGEDPGQQLPVAADPAMQPAGIFRIAAREIFVEHDIGGERGAAVRAFEQVVAQNTVFGHPAVHASVECTDIVDAFTHENSGAEQVLVDVGNRAAVNIDGGVSGEQAREQAPCAADRRNLHARLHDRIAANNPAAFRVHLRPVEGMGQCRGQLCHRSGWQHGIAIDGYDEPHARKRSLVADMQRKAGFISFRQQAVELLEFPAFAFPGHPAAFRRIVAARPQQEVEWAGPIEGVPTIKLTHVRGESCLDRGVARPALCLCIGEVGQQRYMQVRVGIGQPMRFDLFRQLSCLGLRRDDDGHHNHGAYCLRDALVEIELRQDLRRQYPSNRPVNQGDHQHRGRQGSECEHRYPAARPGADIQKVQDGNEDGSQAGNAHGQPVEESRPGEYRSNKPASPGGDCTDFALELRPALGDQPVADMVADPLRSAAVRTLDDTARDKGLITVSVTGNLLDRAPVSVAGFEIHAGVVASRIAAQDFLDLARPVEKVLPRGRGDIGQVDDCPGHALGLFERLRIVYTGRQFGGRLDLPVEQRGDGADQNLDAGDAQHCRKRPQLGYGEGFAVLEGVYETHGVGQRQLKSRGAQEFVGNGEDARHPLPAFGNCRETSKEARRQVVLNLTEGTLDLVVIVEQPFGRLARIGRRGDAGAPRFLKPFFSLGDPRPEGNFAGRTGNFRDAFTQLLSGKRKRRTGLLRIRHHSKLKAAASREERRSCREPQTRLGLTIRSGAEQFSAKY